ncbi:fatty acid/sphingolipid desaturase [Phanerochaete sordida]|uniref:Delta 8-(E)-sphingolipid desaturase n=1 Tax=Phanerochaete sordida TaxID=48140 RepID=A0A9P3G4E6_9APHY|nr:fatty acid/sphingolipid desaturase [Phanerochaete sordida]
MGKVHWTRDQVAQRILAGETLFILQNKVIRVPPSWLKAHPGGALAILHFVGRNATDEVDAFHSEETLRKIGAYAVAEVEVGGHGWESFLPPVMSGWVRKVGTDGQMQWHREATTLRPLPEEVSELSPSSQILLVRREQLELEAQRGPTFDTLQPGPSTLSPKVQAEHSKAYKELHRRVTDAGLYKTRYITGYGPEIVRYVSFVLLAIFFYHKSWFLTSAFFLGLYWHQVTFTAHDLGHLGVTHDWVIDRTIAMLVANLSGGLSIGWWVDNHNIHHLVTNHPTHDPDIQHLPFFAISPVFFTSLWSSYYKRVMAFDAFAKVLITVQHKLFYVIMGLARFNLYANSYAFLAKTAFQPPKAKGGRWWWWTEVTFLGLFYCWYIRVLRGCGSWPVALGYLLISNVVPSPLHVQIVLSHFSRSTADLGVKESFLARQLRTTVDVICSPSIEWIHGGLHLQVTHHLFPRLPRHNLRAASALVKEYAEKEGLEYAEFGFIDGNSEVRGVLRQVAEQAKIVGMVADAHVKEHMQGSEH